MKDASDSEVTRMAMQSKSVQDASRGIGEMPQLIENLSDRSDDREEAEKRILQIPEKKTKKSIKPRGPGIRALGYFLRSILLDFPLVFMFFTYMGLVWLHRLHDVYLIKQLEALVWTSERAEKEITYYQRSCTVEDMSTTVPNDLFLPHNVTPEEAYHHQLKHGFSVFPSALSREAAADIREHIDSKNRQLRPEESIYLVEGENRFSFVLDTSEPSVARAITDLSNNKPLSQALEKIMGYDPALIEMTSITSASGSIAQWWHDDTPSEASPGQFARTFGPSLSLFIMLQDTTKEMGATSACPGTHYCAIGEMSRWCETHGVQVVSDEGYWRTGDALLMNMDSWHRGAAHTDPDALDRVMLILTFVPKPRPRAESRQMAQGITFSLRWDHWGLTWRDLKAGRFAFPWLRALSIYKPAEAAWGMDYISSSSMRIANHDQGFSYNDLDVFRERGGIWYLPKFLHGDVNDEEDESWYHYFLSTLLKCEDFAKKVNIVAVCVYLVLFLLINVTSAPHKGLGRAMHRIVISYGLIFAGYLLLCSYVDKTDWASDILESRRYTSAFGEEEPEYPLDAPSTFPYRADVLVETRYGSPFLEMYNDWFENHPGNNLLDRLVDAITPTYRDYPELFRGASVAYIVGVVKASQGRFLHQSTEGAWRLMSDEYAAHYVKSELHLRSFPILPKLKRAIRFIMSDYKYGIYRGTSLAKTVSLPYLRYLQEELLSMKGSKKGSNTKARPGTQDNMPLLRLVRTFKMPSAKTNAQRTPYKLDLVVKQPRDPYPCAWCKSGDFVEVKLFDDDGVAIWYVGTLSEVTATGRYHIEFFDGESFEFFDGEDDSPRSNLRPFIPYTAGETVGVAAVDEEFWEKGTVDDRDEDGYSVTLFSGKRLDGVHPGRMQRF